ncbi:MAG: hypothetical protein A2175_00400 [Candidatus Nealsonbacteria bacterium RBG_13_42_11]|uniref:Nucleotidyl transferase AbiEii/AbiGii toxin family protein n=1 Tax=Candidatus Nealsonbacteria bacterium RBG_13_42_11 TaxID=1801663 RepID=A0A1G2DYW9_9BACT|nr:MAG: hypothetical protein A2175_00400 [Candidatus Nealsonbacteria bacterium RBG_13_42_11]
MIAQETIQKLATQRQTSEFPNVVREYFQHLFLSQLYRIEGAENILFKGGTALRIIYGSPRFSEDLDFSIFNIEQYQQEKFIEDIFAKVLVEIERSGIKVELGPKPGSTKEGYYGEATFKIYDYPSVVVSINVSSRNSQDIKGEVDSISSDFVPTYNVFHLPQEKLVEEKIEALLERKKARDFYDLYFIMRKGFLILEQKKRLNSSKDEIIKNAGNIDFSSELLALLPQDQQAIIKDFKNNLFNELNRQLSGI